MQYETSLFSIGKHFLIWFMSANCGKVSTLLLESFCVVFSSTELLFNRKLHFMLCTNTFWREKSFLSHHFLYEIVEKNMKTGHKYYLLYIWWYRYFFALLYVFGLGRMYDCMTKEMKVICYRNGIYVNARWNVLYFKEWLIERTFQLLMFWKCPLPAFNPVKIFSTWNQRITMSRAAGSPVLDSVDGHPSMYYLRSWLLNFSDRLNLCTILGI